MPSLPAIEIPADVLKRAQAGDSDAHEYLYRLLSRPVYTLILRMVNRPAVAEELLQDVFVEILRSVQLYSGTGSFIGWVKSIAVTRALMYLRSPWHRGLTWLAAEDIFAPEEASTSIAESLDAALELALEALPAAARAIVWLHDVEGYTHAEIARFFHRTPSFSKSQLARAHQQLRASLQSQSGAPVCTPITRNC
jgi:RNA polymerase sigma-70 factor (ECF subfamily)